MKLYKSKKLLNLDENPKTIKGQKLKVKTAILYLAPANESGFNMCPMASAGCKAACLFTAGRGQMSNVRQGRINKTIWFMKDRTSFLKQLIFEIKKNKLNHYKEIIIKEMENALKPKFDFSIPLVVDYNHALNWSDAH